MPPTVAPPTTTLPPGCGAHRPADLVFAMPTGADRAEAQKVLQMMSGVTEQTDVGEDAVRVGLVPKDCFTVPGFQLKHTQSKEQLLAKIDGRYAAASRGTQQILKYLRKNSFTEDNGARPEAANIAILILDDSSDSLEESIMEATKSRDEEGIHLIVVRVGDKVSAEEAELIASRPDHIISVNSYDDLPSLATQLKEMMDEICDGECCCIDCST